MFFWCAKTETMPNIHIYLIVALCYTYSVYKTMRDLSDIPVTRLVRKAVSFAE